MNWPLLARVAAIGIIVVVSAYFIYMTIASAVKYIEYYQLMKPGSSPPSREELFVLCLGSIWLLLLLLAIMWREAKARHKST